MADLTSIEQIQLSMNKIRELRKGYLTNLFLDIDKWTLWIKNELIEYETVGNSVFFFKRNAQFYHLYFMATDHETLSNDLILFQRTHPNKEFVSDILGSKTAVSVLKAVFIKNGYYEYTSLVRMSRINSSKINNEQKKENIVYANIETSKTVFDLMYKFFDERAEQLPLLEEFFIWSENNRIIVCTDDMNNILGFLIFDLVGQTSFLRYWFVHPDHRDKKIGSLLLHKFFEDSLNSKRQLFWVIETNKNAIDRYEHFGFKKEDMFDCVLINKEFKYER
jgi:ribosomal protein S18 acetylase RimI-like enzyme